MKALFLLVLFTACLIFGNACVTESTRKSYTLSSSDPIPGAGLVTGTPKPKKAK